MEQGITAIALVAIMLGYSTTADAVAWKARSTSVLDDQSLA